ncbi:hypothetical protein [Natronoglycomyces albus]|uniref:Uncharacterized protein n=1 Tax=Natronoglycomyces albus TaxID=2811108 RepID=A0A895XTK6_9ACTN|nr:hypothetical protein [Natronoglycomyces albus]QSB04968.1 hypothetical protein JQS30_14570 [Natronoglycomyces albus]
MEPVRFNRPIINMLNGRIAPAGIHIANGPSVLDQWGAHMEPGKYYGRFLSEGTYFYLYGSWRGDSISIHREDNRDAEPYARVYLTPRGGWWMQPYVWGAKAVGLTRLNDNFQAYISQHPELGNL